MRYMFASVRNGSARKDMPNPTVQDLKDPLFEAIWKVTKSWDVNAPEYYEGYCGMNGSHVKLILDAIDKAILENGELNDGVSKETTSVLN